jgi:hypothetical protein
LVNDWRLPAVAVALMQLDKPQVQVVTVVIQEVVEAVALRPITVLHQVQAVTVVTVGQELFLGDKNIK